MSPNSLPDPSQDTTSPGAAHGYAAVRVSAPPALKPGSLLANRYEIIRQLGQGGMGAVYQARDIELDRVVAIKVIRPELANDRSILQRFKQELVLARQVTHRNVVRIYDLGEAEGLKFITMEYVEGVDLKTALRTQGKLPASEAVQIMQQICRALDAAHSEGVIHRDLKPSNVMRDAHGKVLVMDFGLARSGDGSGLTQTGAMVGTLEYMAPEQANCEPADPRSDIYAAGLIFYELLTGKMPFPAESAIASLMKRARERAVPPSEVEKTVPRVLSGIVCRCLDPEREKRYQSAAELLGDLEAFQPSSHFSAATVIARPAATPRIYKWLTIVFAILLVAAAGTLVWRHYTKAVPAQHAPVSVLVSDFENTTADPVFDGTLEPAFTLALEGAPFITSYNRGQAQKLAAQLQPGTTKLDEQVARLVATREGVNVVVGGNIARDGNSYRVTVGAVDGVTGKVIASDSERVQKKDVLVAMGKLAAGIRKALGDTTPKSVQLAAAETFSSTSLEAAQHYARGQDLSAAGKHEDALREYEEAIKLDPQLGRAYSGMAIAEYVLGHRAETERYYKLALENIGRMTDREKYRSRGGYYLVVAREPDKAIEEFSALVREYPADSAGLGNLAFAYFSKRDMARALEEGRRALDIYPKSVPIRNNVGLYAMYAGDFDASIKEHQQVLDENPKFLLAYVGEAMSQLGKGDVEAAGATWQKLQAVSPRGASIAAAGLADLALYQGRIREAEDILEPAILADLKEKDNDAAGSKLALLISAYLSPGQAAKAVAGADRALAASKDPGVEYMAARGYIEGGQEKKALALAQEMTQSLAPDPQLYAKLIEGEVALRHERAREAIDRFRESAKFGDSWLMHFDLGRAYLAANAYPEADSEFEICLKRRGEATAVFLDDNPTYHMLPPVYYYIGRAQEGLKSPAASESYKTFLAMKANADGDLLAADAKKRISSR